MYENLPSLDLISCRRQFTLDKSLWIILDSNYSYACDLNRFSREKILVSLRYGQVLYIYIRHDPKHRRSRNRLQLLDQFIDSRLYRGACDVVGLLGVCCCGNRSL